MNARCTTCNRYLDFHNRRGSKLKNCICQCGGKFELIRNSVVLAGDNPFNPEDTHESSYFIGKYWYARENKKGELFYHAYRAEFWHPVTNYELAKRAEVPTEQ